MSYDDKNPDDRAYDVRIRDDRAHDNRNYDDKSPEEIESEIELTRSRLDETLLAIEQRLEPRQLLDRGVEYARNHGAKEYFVNLGQSAKNEPLPLALVGIGLAWLMLSNRRDRVPPAYRLGMDPSLRSRGSSALDQAGAKVSRTADDLRYRAGETRDRIAGAADDAKHKLSETADDLRHKASDTADELRYKASSTASEVRRR